MFSLKLSPQLITIWLVGIILIPRFFSSYAAQIGTVCILLFWVAILVIATDYVEGYESKDCKLRNYPLPTRLLLIVLGLICIVTFLFRDSIFNKEADSLMVNIRRMLYLFHPLICMAWLPKVRSANKLKFCFIVGVLTFGMGVVLVVPNFLDKIFIGKWLNNLTTHLSASILSLISNSKISVSNNILYTKNYSIKVASVCGSSPQIFLSFFSMLVCYVACKILSYRKLFIILLSAAIVAFIFNSIRISVLGYIVSIDAMDVFEFWHDGLGSLIFSFIIMTITCAIYYILWCKENPIE